MRMNGQPGARVIVLRVISVDGRPGDAGAWARFDERGGVVGRGSSSTLRLDDGTRTVSRVQARIVWRPAGFQVIAEGTLPTRLDGQALEPGREHPLAIGQQLQIGSHLIAVEAEAPPPPSLEGMPGQGLAPQAPGRPAGALAPPVAPPVAPPALPLPVSAPAVRTGTPATPDEVRLGAAAPRAAEPGQSFIVHGCAYPAGHEAAVREALAQLSPQAAVMLGRRSTRWTPGTLVEISLAAEDLQCDEPVQALVWNGAIEILDYVLTVPPDAAPGERIVTLRVQVGGLVVATLRQAVAVLADAAGAPRVSAYGRAAASAFASYAAHDRELVVQVVGAIEQSTGLDLFMDCLDLRPSEPWKARLAEEIGRRDLFLLFWSREARASPWVEWEWRTALLHKGLPAIQVHVLQPNVEPPPELQALHLGSVHALVAEHERLRRP